MKEGSLVDLWKKRLGKHGEQIVAERLIALGWDIKARNWRNGRHGELDIVARDMHGIYVFVEVKTRCLPRIQPGFQTAGFEAITPHKAKKIVTSARCYLAERGLLKTQYRFDIAVVAFTIPADKVEGFDTSKLPNPVITHVEQAIGGF